MMMKTKMTIHALVLFPPLLALLFRGGMADREEVVVRRNWGVVFRKIGSMLNGVSYHTHVCFARTQHFVHPGPRTSLLFFLRTVRGYEGGHKAHKRKTGPTDGGTEAGAEKRFGLYGRARRGRRTTTEKKEKKSRRLRYTVSRRYASLQSGFLPRGGNGR